MAVSLKKADNRGFVQKRMEIYPGCFCTVWCSPDYAPPPCPQHIMDFYEAWKASKHEEPEGLNYVQEVTDFTREDFDKILAILNNRKPK